MVAPYNYLPQVQTPAQALTSGLQFGAQLAQSREAQEASRAQAELRRQQAEEIRRKVQEAEEARKISEAARNKFFEAPDPQTALEWGNTLSAEQLKAFSPFISQLTDKQATRAATDAVRRWSLIKNGNAQKVHDEFMDEATARRNSGNEEGAKFSERQARLALEAPDVAATNYLTAAAVTPQGRDIIKSYTEAQKSIKPDAVKPEGRIISSDKDKLDLGLVDSTTGKPLPGTFFQKPGEKPELVTGEKPDQPKETADIATMRQLGFPITPEGYERFKLTGRGPLVTINNTPEDQSRVQYAKEIAKLGATEDATIVTEANKAPESVNKVDSVLRQLYTSKAITGTFADAIKAVERVRSKFGDAYAQSRVSDTEVLDAMLGSEVFPMIGELGIGARGLDTPAEREFLRQVMTGTIQMDRNSLIRLAEMRRERIERSVENYNNLLQQGDLDKYFEIRGRTKRPVTIPPRLPRPSGLLPTVPTAPGVARQATPAAPTAVAPVPATTGRDIGGGFRVLD